MNPPNSRRKVLIGTSSDRPYSAALAAGPFVFVSGQVGSDPATGELAGADIGTQTTRALRNLQDVLSGAGLNLDDVVKTTVFLTDMSEFSQMNAIYRAHFQQPMPTRSTVEVSRLARPEFKVEIEAIAVCRDEPSEEGR